MEGTKRGNKNMYGGTLWRGIFGPNIHHLKRFRNFMCKYCRTQMLPQKVPCKYNCEKCDYHSNKLSQWKRHLLTGKHKILTDTSKKGPKVSFFTCDCGRSYIHRQSLYNHRKKCFGPKILTNAYGSLQNASPRFVCVCGKEYTHRQSLCKHEKVCKLKQSENDGNCTNNSLKHIQNNAITEDSIQKLILALQEVVPKLGNVSNSVVKSNNTINSNNNNKIINVQMFLSEKCADAMSIQHFAKQLEVTLDDVCKSKKDCITNVVLKNLEPLSLTQRPFHCTNPKSKEWYIKDEKQGWEEDSGEKLLLNAEHGIRKKWVREFESRYPEWMENDQLREKYVEIAGSTTLELPEKTKLKLLRELAGEVHLTKEDMY